MATLNGVEFDIVKKTTTVIHDNNIMDIPGSDTVVQEDLGYSTEPLRIIGHVKNDSEYDDFKEQYYSGGELTLIVDPDSGKQYTVYALRNLTDLDGKMTYPLTDIVFQAIFYMKNPYLKSVTDKTRIKSITANNQEWSADNDGSPLKTDGSVDAVPNIKVTNDVTPLAVINTYNVPGTYCTDLGWDGSNMWSCDTLADKIYKHNADMTVHTQYNSPGTEPWGVTWDGSNMWSCDNPGGIYKHNADMSVNTTYAAYTGRRGLTWDGSNIWSCGGTSIYKHNADMTINATYNSPGAEPTGLVWDGYNIWSCDNPGGKIYKHNMDATLSVAATYNSPASNPKGLAWDGVNIWSTQSSTDKIYDHYTGPIKDVQIYNTADTTEKCDVSNDILTAAVHRINIDGTGTVDYDDDFTNAKWGIDSTFLNLSHDTVNDELDIADDGYIYWKQDTKYPIIGTPTLTSRINITAGTPTIQISTDASTWYDIDTPIADDVETVYPLDSDGNLSLAGKTVFYWRIDCVKAAAATCSVKYFELDINIHTIYAKNPKITKGATASTFRCDQDAASGMNCDVELIFPDRWWA